MVSRSNVQVVTKSELIERLNAKQKQLSAKDVEYAVKSILEYLINSLSKGDRVEIRGFGSFSLRHRKPRIARNPKTGVPVPIAGKSVAHFKPGKPLGDRIRKLNSLSRQEPTE